MKRTAKSFEILIWLLFFAIFFMTTGALYMVDETQQVVVTQFGEPIGQPITQAGLHFKWPFIQNANYFEKRILEWDGDPNQIPTRDKRYIWVETTARWRITDALKFMQSIGNENNAQARLDDIVDAATRDVISNWKVIEAVRDSNRLVEHHVDTDDPDDLDWEDAASYENIKAGREALTKEILAKSAQFFPPNGIELIDVRIKRITYIQEVRKKVYERMIAERKRAAEKFRSEGQGERASVEGQMFKELEQIRSTAYKAAEEIKGKADAEATAIYAESYNKDPEFYTFLKTLETYKNTVNASTTLFLTTDSDFYRYFNSIKEPNSSQP